MSVEGLEHYSASLPLRLDDGSVVRVGNSRISLDLVVEQYENGMTPEEMVRAYREGYDVVVRPVAAYSTLGWFNDPITPQMLRLSEPDLAELILHELTHSEVYVADQTDFNESLGTFVGHATALQFATERWGAGAPEEYIAYAKWLGVQLPDLSNYYDMTLIERINDFDAEKVRQMARNYKVR